MNFRKVIINFKGKVLMILIHKKSSEPRQYNETQDAIYSTISKGFSSPSVASVRLIMGRFKLPKLLMIFLRTNRSRMEMFCSDSKNKELANLYIFIRLLDK